MRGTITMKSRLLYVASLCIIFAQVSAMEEKTSPLKKTNNFLPNATKSSEPTESGSGYNLAKLINSNQPTISSDVAKRGAYTTDTEAKQSALKPNKKIQTLQKNTSPENKPTLFNNRKK